jgi:hypothetical protein
MEHIKRFEVSSFSFISRALFCLLAIFTFITTYAQAEAKVQNKTSGADFRYLQEALDAANPGDTIIVRGRNVGTFIIVKNVTLIGEHDAVLDGANAGTVLTVLTPFGSPNSIIVTVEKLTIQHGLASSQGGGGVLNINANLTLRQVKVINNVSPSNGGGILNVSIGPDDAATLFQPGFVGSTSLFKCKIYKNTAELSGGGIANIGGSLLIEKTKITGNFAQQTGAGLLSFGGSNAIIDSKFIGNAAALQGGGIENIADSATSLNDVEFRDNSAGQAGGIFNGSGGVFVSSVVIEDSEFHGNNTLTLGGALYNDTGSTATVEGSEITKNSATEGGGGIFNNVGGILNVNTTVIHHNFPNNVENL